ncbi:hypothetical protein [Amycolatopsis sp. cmx-4-68]|uniref:hypothetical protein n=1 Tax=Amycolatopsis sp. cmx-4-68 TaxID=2790938 RepID=UPI00397B0BB5
MPNIEEVVNAQAERLLAIPGCTAVAVGKKTVGGVRTDQDAIILHVDRKYDAEQPIPAAVAGFPTDVVEQRFDFRELATDPFARAEPLIGGLSIAGYSAPGDYGSIGCFIEADGTVNPVVKGVYLLTNRHVWRGPSIPAPNRWSSSLAGWSARS